MARLSHIAPIGPEGNRTGVPAFRGANQGLSGPTLWAASAYAFLLPFDFMPLVGGRSATFPVAVALVALVYVDVLSGRVVIDERFPPGVGPTLLSLAAWLSLTAWWTYSFDLTSNALISLYFHIVLLFALRRPLIVARNRLIANYVHGTFAVALLLLSGSADPTRQGRATVGEADENALALGIALGLAVAVYLVLFRPGSRWKLMLAVEAVVISGAVLYTGSRTGAASVLVILCASAAVAVVALIREGRFEPLVFTGAFFAVSGWGFGWATSNGLVPKRVRDFLAAPEVSEAERDGIVSVYLRVFGEWDMFGVGYGADASFLSAQGMGYSNAHSLFWKNWIEGGYPGVILTLAFILMVVISALRGGEWRLAVMMWLGSLPFAISLGGERTDHFWWMVAVSLTGALLPISQDKVTHRGIVEEG